MRRVGTLPGSTPEPHGRDRAGRGRVRRRASPTSTRCRSRSTPSRRTGSRTRSSASGTTTSYGRAASPTTPCTTARRWRCGCRRSPRPARRQGHRATTWPSTGSPGHDLDTEAHSTLFTGEQSNSSVAFGEDSLMKVFRKVTPGRQPRHRRSTRCSPEAGSDHVAALYGWLDVVDDDDRLDHPARDAPAVPAHRQRRLGAGAGQRAQPVRRGRPARRRGRRRLRRRGRPARPRAGRDARDAGRALPGRAGATADDVGELADAMRGPAAPPRSTSCPHSRPMRRRCEATYDALRRARRRRRCSRSTATCTSARPCAPSRAGRSSTSRASRPSRWPSGCCPTRPGATSPGMLRSFDYAPRVVAMTGFALDAGWRGRAAGLPRGRVVRSATAPAFLAAYAEKRGAELDSASRTLLDAYVADKASTRRSTKRATARPGWTSRSMHSTAWPADRTKSRTEPSMTDRGRHEHRRSRRARHPPDRRGPARRAVEGARRAGRRRRHVASGSGPPTRSRSRSPASGPAGTAPRTR